MKAIMFIMTGVLAVVALSLLSSGISELINPWGIRNPIPRDIPPPTLLERLPSAMYQIVLGLVMIGGLIYVYRIPQKPPK
jgi:hypothetical protein